MKKVFMQDRWRFSGALGEIERGLYYLSIIYRFTTTTNPFIKIQSHQQRVG